MEAAREVVRARAPDAAGGVDARVDRQHSERAHDGHSGGGEGGGYSFEKTQTLVSLFDQNVQKARAAHAEVTGGALDEIWTLKMGPQTLMAMPKPEAVRQHMNHFFHHRGQLTVYARLINVPLPMIYGPTADERWGG